MLRANTVRVFSTQPHNCYRTSSGSRSECDNSIATSGNALPQIATLRHSSSIGRSKLIPGSRIWTISLLGCPGSCALRRSEEHTSELQSRLHLVCRLLLEKKKLDE